MLFFIYVLICVDVFVNAEPNVMLTKVLSSQNQLNPQTAYLWYAGFFSLDKSILYTTIYEP